MQNNNYNWKAEFINAIAVGKGIKSYLELGIDKCHTFKQIIAEVKVGVDIDTVADNVCTMETDKFFSENRATFDLIYIDACHEKQQVKRDFLNSYNRLNEDGIIIFHDIHPNSLNDTKFTACGNVYEFWMSMKDHYKIHAVTNTLPDGKDGLGIFIKSENIEVFDFDIPDRSYEEYNSNRDQYSVDISISLEDLISQ